MDRKKIVDPDPGKNYNAAIFAGDPHFKVEKEIYITVVRIVARHQIVMLDDTVLLRKKSCSVSIKYESQITQKCLTAL